MQTTLSGTEGQTEGQKKSRTEADCARALPKNGLKPYTRAQVHRGGGGLAEFQVKGQVCHAFN